MKELVLLKMEFGKCTILSINKFEKLYIFVLTLTYCLDECYKVSGRLLWCCKESKEKSKKVILTNPLDCKNKINLKGMIAKWKGTGHIEWEFILAGLFIHDVVNAIENDDQEADLTFMFNLDFHDKNGNTFTAQQVYDHLIKSFTIVDETDTELKLKFCI